MSYWAYNLIYYLSIISPKTEQFMRNPNRSVLVLFAYLALVFNLEKLGLGAGLSLALNPNFFIVITIAVLGIIAFPIMLKIPLFGHMAGWSGIYLLGRWAIYPKTNPWLELNIYQSITEITLLVLGVAIAYRLANQLQKTEELGKLISLPTTTRQVRNFNTAIEDIKIEFVRSRRYNHPLSLMVIEPSKNTLKEDLDRMILENQKKISKQVLTSRLAEIIVHQARRTDMVLTKNWDGRFIILCPENSVNGTSRLAERIQADMKNTLGVSINYGIAAFPSDALTLEDLLHRAETNITSTTQAAPIAGQTIEPPAPVVLSSGESDLADHEEVQEANAQSDLQPDEAINPT